MRFRHVPLLVFLAVTAAGQEKARVEWVGDWEHAFALAKEERRPVMVCINSKDGERASDATASEIYHDAEFIELSRRFVMVPVSTITHREIGLCPRFGIVTCQQHRQCWTALGSLHGDRLATAFAGEMVSPQHVWFTPDGTLYRRKEYWLEKEELLERMRRVLEEIEKGVDETPPGEPPSPEADARDAPLTDAERAELARAAGADRESRRAALANLLATEKTAARAAVIDLLNGAASAEVKCDVLRVLGRAQVQAARESIEEHLAHKDPLVRSFAAVALECLARPDSVAALLKRVRPERDSMARKNVCRALGACGGPAADKEAAAALLKALNGDKQMMVRKHAALAMRAYSGEAAALVVDKLEKACLKTKDRGVRGGIIYTLAYIGNRDTTAPVFEKVLASLHDDYSKAFVREALRVLRGEASEFGRAAWFLFMEDRDDPARSDPSGD